MTFISLLSIVLVIVVVGLHLICLKGLFLLLPRLTAFRRIRVGIMVSGALVGHLVEIALFGAAFLFLATLDRYGAVADAAGTDLYWGNYFYYSAVTYTSLGFGDLTPTGALRFLSAVEVLTGVVLVAWTASFMFLVMQKAWGGETAPR